MSVWHIEAVKHDGDGAWTTVYVQEGEDSDGHIHRIVLPWTAYGRGLTGAVLLAIEEYVSRREYPS